MAKEGCEIVCIGVTVTDDEVLQNDCEELTDAKIIGVANLEQYRSRLRCKAPTSKGLGRCSKEECKMLQKYDKRTTYISAKLLFQSESTVLSLYAHGQMLCDIAAVDDIETMSEGSSCTQSEV